MGGQFGRPSAPTIPHRVHTIRGPNVVTGTSSDHRSPLRSARWWHTRQHTLSDRTALARMLPSVIGSMGSLRCAIEPAYRPGAAVVERDRRSSSRRATWVSRSRISCACITGLLAASSVRRCGPNMEAIGQTGRSIISIEGALAGAEFVEVRVRDSGSGLPADLVASPFLPFFSTKKKGPASGCHCAGRLSRPMAAASGSTPIRLAPPFFSRCPSPIRPSQECRRPMAEPTQIALVEDDADVRDSLQLYLARRDLKT
jgi:hypothetical protein